MPPQLARFSSLALSLLLTVGLFSTAFAAVVPYSAVLDGPSEAPPNASPGTGIGNVDIDAVAHTMRVRANFGGLIGNVTAAHIHGPTAAAGTGAAGVMTMTPTFLGFPSGVTGGAYDMTFDMTQTSSYNGSFVTANGGTAASAEAALFQAITDGKAYLNIHSSSFGGGEIRGFLVPASPTPVSESSWGRVKALYR